MRPRVRIRSSDLRGAARLATDATSGLTDLVEAMHERIARTARPRRARRDGRTGGITGLVYQTIRGVTRVVGGSIDALLGLLGAGTGAADATTAASARRIVAALNGVLGDYLAATANPLAIPMALRRDGRAARRSRRRRSPRACPSRRPRCWCWCTACA